MPRRRGGILGRASEIESPLLPQGQGRQGSIIQRGVARYRMAGMLRVRAEQKGQNREKLENRNKNRQEQGDKRW
jgi:hypothetical protein